jgi:acyl carrier protein
LRGFLKAKLPEYMVPSALVELEAMPLTPNGKLDRRALPTPEADRSALEEAFVAPRTPVEEALVGIWEEVLGLERIGVHDDFFELGGHSLLAVQVLTRLNRHFGVELPLRTLFEEPTISGLALAVTQRRAEAEIDIEQMLAQVEQMQGRSVPQEFSEER